MVDFIYLFYSPYHRGLERGNFILFIPSVHKDMLDLGFDALKCEDGWIKRWHFLSLVTMGVQESWHLLSLVRMGV